MPPSFYAKLLEASRSIAKRCASRPIRPVNPVTKAAIAIPLIVVDAIAEPAIAVSAIVVRRIAELIEYLAIRTGGDSAECVACHATSRNRNHPYSKQPHHQK